MSKTVQLREIATARSGDKGANANIGIIAEEPEYYEPMKEQITSERVKDFFDNFVDVVAERAGADAGARSAADD